MTASALIERLGLSDDEALGVFAVDALSLITGELDHRPELAILDSLTAAAAEQVGESVLRLWLRVRGSGVRPIEALLARDFGGFEDALTLLVERGFVLGRADR